MAENKPLDEQEQKQLIEIMQLFMQLPDRDYISLHFYADGSGSLFKDNSSKTWGERANMEFHFHDLEEGVELMRNYANPEQDNEDSLFLESDPKLE